MTVPPSKVITDYKKVEGVVTGFSSGHKSNPQVTLQLKNSEQTIRLQVLGGLRQYDDILLKPAVVAYYWPGDVFNGKQVVLMAPVAQRNQYLDDFIKNKGGFDISKVSLLGDIMFGVAFFMLWFIPWCIRGKQLLEMSEKLAQDSKL
tara:strand:- start:96 stop:536 length:441 start_codon:yes stop_codon:yes gene_type:complete